MAPGNSSRVVATAKNHTCLTHGRVFLQASPYPLGSAPICEILSLTERNNPVKISPQDILVTRNDEVLHVQEVVSESNSSQNGTLILNVKDYDGILFTREVNNPEFEICRYATGVSTADAEAYYERERILDVLYDEAGSKDFKALRNYKYNYPRVLNAPSLISANSTDTRSMFRYLDAAENDISAAIEWAESTRKQYLAKVEAANELAIKAASYSKPELGEQSIRLGDNRFHVGGIYRYRFNPEDTIVGHKLGYARVTSVNSGRAYVTFAGGREGYIESTPYHYNLKLVVDGKTFSLYSLVVELLPIGSFQDIQQYLTHESMTDAFLKKVFVNTYLDMFSAGEGKPLCLPDRWELEGTLSEYLDVDRCRAHILRRITEMTLDMLKSVSHVRWVRDELEQFYEGA